MMNKHGGFIALFSVIIISTVLLLATASSNFSGFFGRLNIFNTELKSESENLALACLEVAKLVLAKDLNFVGGGTALIDGETCNYEVSAGGAVLVHAEVNDAFTYYYAEVDLGNPEIDVVVFKECPSLSPCP